MSILRPSRRDHLIETALRLFSRDGFRAVGIDRVLAESGCAKMTLYKHFKSKDELILAVLRRQDERFRNWFMRAVERRAVAPRDRLLALFDALEEWSCAEDFCGCTFNRAAVEFTAADHPIHVVAAEHKRLMQRYVRDLALQAGARDPDCLAESLMLLIEGATVTAHVCGQPKAPSRAREAARTLVDKQLAATVAAAP